MFFKEDGFDSSSGLIRQLDDDGHQPLHIVGLLRPEGENYLLMTFLKAFCESSLVE